MGDQVWQLFVQAASFLSNLLSSLTNQNAQSNGGVSSAAPVNAVPSTSTSTNAINPPLKNLLTITRNRTTTAGVFGDMAFNGEQICFTLENPADLIQPGTYSARLDMSPHLGYVCPHLQVPERDLAAGGDAGLRVHVANWISQLQGCVAVGLQPLPDCMEQSQAAFDKLMSVLPQTFNVIIQTL